MEQALERALRNAAINRTIVCCEDGMYGMVTHSLHERNGVMMIGVQVPGEQEQRWIPGDSLELYGSALTHPDAEIVSTIEMSQNLLAAEFSRQARIPFTV